MKNYEKATHDALIKCAKQNDIPMLYVPKEIRVLQNMPLLATGKIDYVKLEH